MKSGDEIEVTNDSNWESGWIFIDQSQGYSICRNIYSGCLANFRYIRPNYSGLKATMWKCEIK